MKKHHFDGGLFVTLLLIIARCSYLTNKVKNTINHSTPIEQARHAQAQLLAIQSTPDKKYKRNISGLLGLLWLWTLARLYEAEKRRRIPRWHLEDLALLKIIKTNPLRLWNTHRLDRKIIRLEEWR